MEVEAGELTEKARDADLDDAAGKHLNAGCDKGRSRQRCGFSVNRADRPKERSDQDGDCAVKVRWSRIFSSQAEQQQSTAKAKQNTAHRLGVGPVPAGSKRDDQN